MSTVKITTYGASSEGGQSRLSPIEEQMAGALASYRIEARPQFVAATQFIGGGCASRYGCRCEELGYVPATYQEEDDEDSCRWERPGKTVPKYIVDFAVFGPGWKLAVECDGKEYHGGDSAARDVARQRALESQGWEFLRFTGSQIHGDALNCARRVRDWIAERATKGGGA